jgi:hypothetical protein
MTESDELDEAPVIATIVDGPVSLGGATEVPHHLLAVDPPEATDPNGQSFWSRVDRMVFKTADRFNPILIKEGRESLKSRQFLVTFFLLLGATVAWTVLGITFNAPEVYYLPTGPSLLSGYYFLMAIPIFGLVPLAAFRSLSSELEGDTFELLSITKLDSRQIIRGKFASAVLQMMLYLAAVVPSLAFTYLLRGVGLPEIAMAIIAIVVAGLVISAFALMIAPLMSGFLGQSFAMLILIGVIIFSQFVIAGIVLSAVIGQSSSSTAEGWLMTGVVSILSLSFVVLFLKTSAAQIAPSTENRSTSIRWWTLVQQFLWIISMTSVSFYYDEFEPINFGILMLGGYWLAIGTVLLCETKELSPRVRRDLPSTFATRALLGPLAPGPSSGYVFTICTGVVGILSLGYFGTIFQTNGAETQPIAFAGVVSGYLMSYLGLTRLLTLPIAHKRPVPLAAGVCVLVIVVLVAAFLPSVFSVITVGELPAYYQDIEVIDWAWTSVKAFESGGLPTYLGVLMFMAGGLITLINVVFLGDLYAYRKVAVPARVQELEASPQAT